MTYQGKINHADDAFAAIGRDLRSRWDKGEITTAELIAEGAEYGLKLNSPYHAGAIASRASMGNYSEFDIAAYSFGDVGFVAMDSLKYASLPDRYRSIYTAPEVADAYASLNATMDTYALGLVLYQIYNLGKLPFSGEEERKSWLERLAAGEAIEPPVGADEEMGAIITKACAYDPADRWQTPAELGHVLISYMQRNGVEDIPIGAPEEPEEQEEEAIAEEEPAVETAEEAPAEEIPATESPAEAAESPEIPVEEAAEEIIVEETPAKITEEAAQVEESSVESPASEEDLEDSIVEESEAESAVEESTQEPDVQDVSVEEAPAEPVYIDTPVEETPETGETEADEEL